MAGETTPVAGAVSYDYVFASTSLSVPIPAWVVAGVEVVSAVQTGNGQTPSDIGAGLFIEFLPSPSDHLFAQHRRADATDEANNVANGNTPWGYGVSNGFIVIVSLCGYSNTDPVTTYADIQFVNYATGASRDSPGVTAPATDSLFGMILLSEHNSGTVTPPGGDVNVDITGTSPYLNGTNWIAHAKVPIGPTGVRTWTAASAFGWAAVSFTFNAAGGPPTADSPPIMPCCYIAPFAFAAAQSRAAYLIPEAAPPAALVHPPRRQQHERFVARDVLRAPVTIPIGASEAPPLQRAPVPPGPRAVVVALPVAAFVPPAVADSPPLLGITTRSAFSFSFAEQQRPTFAIPVSGPAPTVDLPPLLAPVAPPERTRAVVSQPVPVAIPIGSPAPAPDAPPLRARSAAPDVQRSADPQPFWRTLPPIGIGEAPPLVVALRPLEAYIRLQQRSAVFAPLPSADSPPLLARSARVEWLAGEPLRARAAVPLTTTPADDPPLQAQRRYVERRSYTDQRPRIQIPESGPPPVVDDPPLMPRRWLPGFIRYELGFTMRTMVPVSGAPVALYPRYRASAGYPERRASAGYTVRKVGAQ